MTCKRLLIVMILLAGGTYIHTYLISLKSASIHVGCESVPITVDNGNLIKLGDDDGLLFVLLQLTLTFSS